MIRHTVAALVLLSAGAAAAHDGPGPHDALRYLTIEEAEALLAPVCPDVRLKPGSTRTARVSGEARVPSHTG